MRVVDLLALPLSGAFIGWFTNYVVIRMLFRPLRPWRVLGFRLPLTPGIIPAKRHDLAVNIGRMVGDRLLTSADLGLAVAKPGFRRQLEALIQARLGEFLERELGPLPTLIPPHFRDSFEAGVDILRWRAVKLLHDHLDQAEFRQGLKTTIGEHLDLLLSRPLADWLDPEGGGQGLVAALGGAVQALLTRPQTESWLREACRQRIAGLKDCNVPLDELLPAAVIRRLSGLLQDEVPGLLARLPGLIREPGARELAARIISEAIGSLVSPLGPVATLVKGLFSPERLKDKIAAYLESREAELARWLQNDQTQAQARAAVAGLVNGLMRRPPAELLARLGPEDEEALAGELAGGIVALLRQPQAQATIESLIAGGLAALYGRRADLMLSELLGPGFPGRLRDQAGAGITAAILSAKGRRLLDGIVTTLLDDLLLRRPIGPLAKLLPKEVRKRLEEYLWQQGHDLLVAETPRLFEFVNIEEIVTRKVDSLDPLRLESLLFGIMEKQFTYINLFGGLLGLVIGLFNLALIAWR